MSRSQVQRTCMGASPPGSRAQAGHLTRGAASLHDTALRFVTLHKLRIDLMAAAASAALRLGPGVARLVPGS